MDMDWGMENRMARLIQPDGHCMFLPIDHGYFQGPTRMLEQPGETIIPLLPYSDALFVTRGVLRAVVDPAMNQPVILRVSGGTSMVGEDLANEGLTTSMEDAVRLNVAAVGISVFIGSEYEKQSLLNLGKLVDEGEKYGIPVMAVTAVGKELEKRDARYLGLCSRICAELGAKVVKTYWCEEFEKNLWPMIKKNKNYLFKIINGPQNPKLVTKYNIKTYPSLVKINGSKYKIFKDEKNLNNIRNFLR